MQIGVEPSRAVENKRIFVISEDDITRTALQFMLHDENEAHELADLDAAYAKAADSKPDLVLIDLAIIERQGAPMLEKIAEQLRGVKIVLIAEPGEDAHAQTYLKSGAHSVLAKPLTVEAVRRKVNSILGRNDAGMVKLQILPTQRK